MQVKQLKRQFIANGLTLADPDPRMSAEEVRNFFANGGRAWLLTAEIVEKETDGDTMVIEFRKAVGTKG